MSKHRAIYLPDDQRTTLTPLLRAGKAPARTQMRARILGLLDRKQAHPFPDDAVAKALLWQRHTVGNVRRRCVTAGLPAALYDQPRPPRAPKQLTGEVQAHWLALACSAPPQGQQRWTLRLRAERLVARGLGDRISPVAVGERRKKTN